LLKDLRIFHNVIVKTHEEARTLLLKKKKIVEARLLSQSQVDEHLQPFRSCESYWENIKDEEENMMRKAASLLRNGHVPACRLTRLLRSRQERATAESSTARPVDYHDYDAVSQVFQIMGYPMPSFDEYQRATRMNVWMQMDGMKKEGDLSGHFPIQNSQWRSKMGLPPEFALPASDKEWIDATKHLGLNKTAEIIRQIFDPPMTEKGDVPFADPAIDEDAGYSSKQWKAWAKSNTVIDNSRRSQLKALNSYAGASESQTTVREVEMAIDEKYPLATDPPEIVEKKAAALADEAMETYISVHKNCGAGDKLPIEWRSEMTPVANLSSVENAGRLSNFTIKVA